MRHDTAWINVVGPDPSNHQLLPRRTVTVTIIISKTRPLLIVNLVYAADATAATAAAGGLARRLTSAHGGRRMGSRAACHLGDLLARFVIRDVRAWMMDDAPG